MLDARKSQGFNAINLALMFHWANMEPSGYGVFAGTPGNWNTTYWEHVDYIVDGIISREMHPIIFPAWGNLMGGENNLFNQTTAEEFGRWIANRYKNRNGIIYALGGDRVPNQPIIEAVGRGLKAVSPDRLVSFHPHNSKSSSLYFHNSTWLDFNMIQSGHHTTDQTASFNQITGLIEDDYQLTPVKPTMDIEPRYEEYYPNEQPPPFDDYDVRVAAYWGVFAGGSGTGYAHNQVWSWGHWGGGESRVWSSINSTAASQMRYLRELILSRPFFTRVQAQALVSGNPSGVIATRGDHYALIILHEGQNVTINLGILSGSHLNIWWYNPRTGAATQGSTISNSGSRTFNPPGGSGRGNDWVLVLDDVNSEFPAPGEPYDNNPLPALLLTANQWHQITVPGDMGAHRVSEIFEPSLLGTQGEDWAMWVYEAATGNYRAPSQDEYLPTGTGFWFIHLQPSSITVRLPQPGNQANTSTSAFCTSAVGCFETPLIPHTENTRWKLLGYPLSSESNIGDWRVSKSQEACATGCTINDASANGVIHHQLWLYSPQEEAYSRLTSNDQIQPGDSPWLAILPSDFSDMKVLFPKAD